MTTAATVVRTPRRAVRPQLLFIHSRRSGECRRVEGYLAQVLQRRRNHSTFALRLVATEDAPELAERLKVGALPTILVVDDRRVTGRLERPRGCREIEAFLKPWLR